jgi:hypothetical protein
MSLSLARRTGDVPGVQHPKCELYSCLANAAQSAIAQAAAAAVDNAHNSRQSWQAQ